jgi:LysM repeat protein
LRTSELSDSGEINVPERRSSRNVVFAGLTAVLAVVALLAAFAAFKSLNTYRANPAQPASPIPVQIPVRTGIPTEQSFPTPASATACATPAPDVPTIIPPTNTPVPPALTATPLPLPESPFTYGLSFGGRELGAYRLGTGLSARAIVGGIHGGYEWNTVVLVSETLEYLQEHPDLIPAEVTLYIVPCANPDGYAAGTDPVVARMNGNGVDLNRNWDFHWQMTATHGTRSVFAGTGPFSEPETRALRDLIEEQGVEAAIFYHSAMGKIFSGADRTQSATFELAEMMSEVTGYPHAPEGVVGQVTTGDAIDYLSTKGVAAIEIELTTHEHIDWDRNLQGILAFLNWTILTRESYIRYVVQPGDVLSTIALRYGVEVEEIMRVNEEILDQDYIPVGYELLIPVLTDD